MAKRNVVTRRKFLKVAGGAVGVGIAACGGTAYFGTRSPAKVVFPNSTCPSFDDKRLLVTYASKSGATGEIADRITTSLCNRGYAVDLKHFPDVGDISTYSGFVMGSPVYMGRVMGSFVSFIEKFQQGLRSRPSAFFGVGLTMKEDSPENRTEMDTYFAPAIDALQPEKINYFGGRIKMDTLPFLYRVFAQADTEGILTEGDYRDWNVIDNWANQLAEDLI